MRNSCHAGKIIFRLARPYCLVRAAGAPRAVPHELLQLVVGAQALVRLIYSRVFPSAIASASLRPASPVPARLTARPVTARRPFGERNRAAVPVPSDSPPREVAALLRSYKLGSTLGEGGEVREDRT